MKTLSSADIRNIEVSLQRVKDAAYELDMLKLRQQVLQQKAKNLELIVSLKGYEINEKSEMLNSVKRQHSEFMKGLKEQYGITSDSWGYDPESGEIV